MIRKVNSLKEKLGSYFHTLAFLNKNCKLEKFEYRGETVEIEAASVDR
jgi:hypothetical protein